MLVFLGPTPVWQRTMVFERFAVDAVNRAVEVREYASGKSNNAARVARALGATVVSCGFAGGARGKAMEQDLLRVGITPQFVEVEHPTRECVTVVDREGGTATELVEEAGPATATQHERLLDVVRGHVGRRCDAVVCSGTLTPGEPAGYFAKVVEIAKARNVPTIVDTRGPTLSFAVKAGATLVKPNAAELGQTVGRPVTTEAEIVSAARELIAQGCEWVLVTRGGEPAVAVSRDKALRLHIPKVQVVNPIGSGDSVAGGLAYGLGRMQTIEESLPLAIACGSANALTLLAGEVDPDVARRLAGQVRVEQV
jgi:tagatose 6-phosphate kinase